MLDSSRCRCRRSAGELAADGPNARREGNAFVGGALKTLKGRRRTLPPPQTARCPRAHPASNGRTAISRLASSSPISCSTRPSTRSRRAISRSKRAARWPTGRAANSSALLHAERDPDGRLGGAVGRHSSRAGRGDQRIHRRRLGSKIPGTLTVAVPASPREEVRRARDDADQPRRGALHRPLAAVAAGAGQNRLPQGRARDGGGHVRPRGCRPLRGSIRPPGGADDVLAGLPADRDALPRPVGADQYAASTSQALLAAHSRTRSWSR